MVRPGRPLHLPDVGLHDVRERQGAHLRRRAARDTRALPDRRHRQEGGGLHPPPRAGRRAVLPVGRRSSPRTTSRATRSGSRGSWCARRRATAGGSRKPPSAGRRATTSRTSPTSPGSSAAGTAGSRRGAMRRSGHACASARSRCSRSTRRSRRSCDELSRTGELDDTYVIFTSDNGYMQGEHRVPLGKMLPYDPSTQVPLLIRGPAPAERRRRRRRWWGTSTWRQPSCGPRRRGRPCVSTAARSCPSRAILGCAVAPAAAARDGRKRRARPCQHAGGRRAARADASSRLAGGAHDPLAVRRLPGRPARALRPEAGPTPAALAGGRSACAAAPPHAAPDHGRPVALQGRRVRGDSRGVSALATEAPATAAAGARRPAELPPHPCTALAGSASRRSCLPRRSPSLPCHRRRTGRGSRVPHCPAGGCA